MIGGLSVGKEVFCIPRPEPCATIRIARPGPFKIRLTISVLPQLNTIDI